MVSALAFRGQLGWLKAAWANRTVTPIICRETIAELSRILAYPKLKLSPQDQQDLFGLYLPNAEMVDLPDPLPGLPVRCRDVDDDIFMHLALIAQADFLVTGDKDLLALAGVAPVRILGIAAWRAVLD